MIANTKTNTPIEQQIFDLPIRARDQVIATLRVAGVTGKPYAVNYPDGTSVDVTINRGMAIDEKVFPCCEFAAHVVYEINLSESIDGEEEPAPNAYVMIIRDEQRDAHTKDEEPSWLGVVWGPGVTTLTAGMREHIAEFHSKCCTPRLYNTVFLYVPDGSHRVMPDDQFIWSASINARSVMSLPKYPMYSGKTFPSVLVTAAKTFTFREVQLMADTYPTWWPLETLAYDLLIQLWSDNYISWAEQIPDLHLNTGRVLESRIGTQKLIAAEHIPPRKRMEKILTELKPYIPEPRPGYPVSYNTRVSKAVLEKLGWEEWYEPLITFVYTQILYRNYAHLGLHYDGTFPENWDPSLKENR